MCRWCRSLFQSLKIILHFNYYKCAKEGVETREPMEGVDPSIAGSGCRPVCTSVYLKEWDPCLPDWLIRDSESLAQTYKLGQLPSNLLIAYFFCDLILTLSHYPLLDYLSRHPLLDYLFRHPLLDYLSRHPLLDYLSRHPLIDYLFRHPLIDYLFRHLLLDYLSYYPFLQYLYRYHLLLLLLKKH